MYLHFVEYADGNETPLEAGSSMAPLLKHYLTYASTLISSPCSGLFTPGFVLKTLR